MSRTIVSRTVLESSLDGHRLRLKGWWKEDWAKTRDRIPRFRRPCLSCLLSTDLYEKIVFFVDFDLMLMGIEKNRNPSNYEANSVADQNKRSRDLLT